MRLSYAFVKDINSLSEVDVNLICNDCTDLTPDTDEISYSLTVLAQNAVISLGYIYDFIKAQDTTFIEYCSDKLFESIDIIHDSEESIEDEMSIQIYYITEIAKIAEFDQNIFDSFKSLNHKNKIVI